MNIDVCAREAWLHTITEAAAKYRATRLHGFVSEDLTVLIVARNRRQHRSMKLEG